MRARLILLLLAVAFRAVSGVLATEPTPVSQPAWYSRLSPVEPGSFAPPRSYQADYRIAWGGLEAAHVNAEVAAPAGDSRIRTEVRAATTGTARVLYQLDATHVSVIDRNSFRPQSIDQTERGSHKNTATRVEFTADGATRNDRELAREDHPKVTRKPKSFAYPGMVDMEGALLQFRSLPLADGDEKTYLVMTATNPYLVTLKVVGRAPVHVQAGDFPSIQCSLKLEKIGKNGTLEPRKGFKSGLAWLSDDANRLLIKAQVDIFIGAVSLELEKIRYADPAR